MAGSPREVFVPDFALAAIDEATAASDALDPRLASIRRYEDFIANRLQVDLQQVLEERDKIYEAIAQHLKLKTQIETIISETRNESKALKMMVDVGSDFFMQAKVTKTDEIFVNVGLDCHLQMTMSEALSFIDVREKQLQKRAEQKTDKASRIKAHIKFMLAALQELLEDDVTLQI
ncbi:Prefoldin subunit-domain-containing protein [Zopfochytrium polystomum]|nr:Prefoldin subunit-domain-containing protein [Zopfochytrium polystomum]